MPTVVLRREAQRDLSRIDDFSWKQFGNRVADLYIAALDAAFERLAQYPEIGSSIVHSKAPIRSLRDESHRILYYFDGNRVIVVRILHKAMDVQRRL